MRYSLLLLLLFSFLVGKSQDRQRKPLKIGDRVPDLLLENLMNGNGQSTQISKLYQPGLLIVNFWATWCIPCVEELPRLDKLQEKLKGKYQMLCVSNENKKAVEHFLNKRKGIKNLKFLAADSLLHQYFPHITVPQNIWIDGNGFVRAITGDSEVTEEDIKGFVLGNIPVSNGALNLNFDYKLPYRAADSILLKRSILTGYNSAISNGGVKSAETDSIPKRYFAWNCIKTDLLWGAIMNKGGMLPRDWDFVEIHTRDSSSFFFPKIDSSPGKRKEELRKYNSWAAKNLFCYELLYSKAISLQNFYRYMAEELPLLFNVQAFSEEKETWCWIIKRKPNCPPPVMSKTGVKQLLRIQGIGTLLGKRQSLSEIANSVSRFYPKEPPFINETGITYPIDLYKDFGDLTDGLSIEKLARYFDEIGLVVVKAKRNYPFLIIRDLN